MLLAAVAVLELHGTPYERGLAHGTTLKPEIARHVQSWKRSVAEAAKADADATLARFLSRTRFKEAAEKWTPELLDEIRGIADGSGQPYDTIFALQLLDELWVFLETPGPDHCSIVAMPARGTEPGFIAQNFDLEPFRDGTQAVLHIAAHGETPEELVFTAAGMVALNGVNDRSVAVAVNTLAQLSTSSEGLPVAFVIRGLLARRSAAEAIRFLKQVKHASGQSYVIGSPEGISAFEASAGGVSEVRTGAGAFCHTNHPVASRDLRKRDGDAEEEANSRSRARSLGAALAAKRAEIGVEDARGLLAATPPAADCITFGATVMRLAHPASFEVTAGPFGKGEPRRLTLEQNETKGSRP
jgi:isopenicillin-N N-acyltransferase-like protein